MHAVVLLMVVSIVYLGIKNNARRFHSATSSSRKNQKRVPYSLTRPTPDDGEALDTINRVIIYRQRMIGLHFGVAAISTAVSVCSTKRGARQLVLPALLP